MCRRRACRSPGVVRVQRPTAHWRILGFDCTPADQVAAWADKLDTLGFEHGPIEHVPYAWVVTA